MHFFKIIFISLVFAVISFGIEAQEVIRKQPIQTQCGAIIEDEFLTNFDQHSYLVTMAPGDIIRASITPLGDQLQTGIEVVGPSNISVSRSDEDGSYVDPESQPSIETGILSARGQYTIFVRNYSGLSVDGRAYGSSTRYSGGVGVYTLFIGCTLRDGTVINPGDSASADSASGEDDSATITEPSIPTPDPNVFGFPGLAPVDFTNGVTIPLQADVPNSGSISTGFEGIFGYSFEAQEGQTMTLDLTRTGGNLNLGIVLLSAGNQVAFQASLVTSNSLSTELVIPFSDEYTLGVFRIDLIPPDAPENTSFTVSAILN